MKGASFRLPRTTTTGPNATTVLIGRMPANSLITFRYSAAALASTNVFKAWNGSASAQRTGTGTPTISAGNAPAIDPVLLPPAWTITPISNASGDVGLTLNPVLAAAGLVIVWEIEITPVINVF